MRFEPYWARATATIPAAGGESVTAYGHSPRSLEEAQRNAAEAARRLAEHGAAGAWPERYAYEDGRPLREEVVEELADAAGPIAVLTRNSYGCLVVNAADAMFIDIDAPGPVVSLLKAIGRLFGRSSSGDDPAVARVRQIVDETRGIGLRLYRTAKGLRGLVTNAPMNPEAEATIAMLARFDADPQYIRLCRVQKCFRARVSPKPWRCDCRRPPTRYPWDSAGQESAYREWELEYHERTQGFAACELIGTFGERAVHPRIQRVIELHDGLACVGGILA